MSVICPTCGSEYESVGRHWAQSDCSYPEPSEEQKRIFIGLFLGDGSLCRDSKNPAFSVGMTNLKFLKWLDDKLGIISCGVNKNITSEEAKKRAIQHGLEGANKSKFQDVYKLYTRRLPYFHKLSEWYEEGKKMPPESLRVTPLSMKMWYVSDGSIANSSTVSIHSNISQNIHKNIIEEAGFDCGISSRGEEITIYSNQSEKFFDWIGKPVPGFNYKWPENYRHC